MSEKLHLQQLKGMQSSKLGISERGFQQGGGGKRRGLGPRDDVLTTCKAVTLRGRQRIVALFPTVNDRKYF